jgi:hypothetical protein
MELVLYIKGMVHGAIYENKLVMGTMIVNCRNKYNMNIIIFVYYKNIAFLLLGWMVLLETRKVT